MNADGATRLSLFKVVNGRRSLLIPTQVASRYQGVGIAISNIEYNALQTQHAEQ